MKKRLLYLIPLIIIGIFLGLIFNKENITKSQLSYLDIKLASYPDVQNGENAIEGTDNVKFDAYFLVDKDNDGIADKIRGNYLEIGKNGKLTIELTVTNEASLNNIVLSFNNKNIITSYMNSNISEISLGNLESGTNKTIKVTLKDNIANDISSYNALNKVTLYANVLENEQEINITKEVEFTMDWYKTNLTSEIKDEGSSVTLDNDKVVVAYSLKTLSKNARMMKSVNLSMSVPSLNGVKPNSVKVNGTNINYNYDESQNILTVYRNATLRETTITNSAYDYIDDDGYAINSFTIILEYPVEAGLIDSTIPLNVTTYHELYNNPESESGNILTSNPVSKVLCATLKSDEIITSIDEGGPIPYLISAYTEYYKNNTSIDKTPVLKIYNNESSVNYTDYSAKLSTNLYYTLGKVNKIIIKDTDYDSFNDSYSMMNVSKYKSIRFDNPSNVLSEGGYIKLYDADTNEIIHVFTKDDWNDTYIFDTDVRKITIETSSIEGINPKYCKTKSECEREYSTVLTTYITKTIDNELVTNIYTQNEVNSFSYIKTSVSTNLEAENQGTHNQERDYVGVLKFDYITPKSASINLNINKTNLPIKSEYQQVELIISNEGVDDLNKAWPNGEFILAFPSEILDIKVNSIGADAYSSSYLYNVEKRNNVTLLKIISLTNIGSNGFKINADVLVDPRVSSKDIRFNLYGINSYYPLSNNTSYDKYDLNNNGSTNDYVNSSSFVVSLDDSNEIRTVTVLKIKDSQNNERIVVTPLIAEIDPVKDNEKVNVEINVINNSSDGMSDIKILGKVGFAGNTYILNNIDLGSEYNMTMGTINVPSNIRGNTKVYYSTKENPTNDIDDLNNDWQQNVVDFTDIKTYLIVVEDYTLDQNNSLIFTYEANMPMNTGLLNKTSYLTHGVYFKRVTEAGLVSGNPIEQRKTGIMMSRKYSLSLTNNKAFTNKPIANSMYVLEDEDGNQNILKTDSSGNATFEDLYVEKEYKIKQLYVNYSYSTVNEKQIFILDEEEKIFKVVNQGTDSLGVNTQGVIKIANITNNVLNLILENEVKYDLLLTNRDIDTFALVPGAKYKITGKGFEDSKILITNTNGELQLNGLYLSEEYTVENISMVEHLTFTEPFTFYLKRRPNGQVALAKEIQLEPDFGDATTITNNNGSNGLSCYYYSSNNYYECYSNSRYSSDSIDEGYSTIDLTNYYGEYKFDYEIYNQRSDRNNYYYKLILTTDINHIPSQNEIKVIYNPRNTGTISTAYQYNLSTNSYTQVPLEGGKKYYLYMYVRNPNSDNYETRFYIRNFRKSNDSVDDTMYYNSTSNVQNETNENVYQTIIDGIYYDNPILKLDVLSKKIPLYTLDVNKVSADTKEALSGAQFIIKGSGLPLNGKYITTDSNGKATIALKEEYHIADDYLLTDYGGKYIFNGYDYSVINGEYSIQEVAAPIGYQIDNKEIQFKLNKLYNSSICEKDDDAVKYNCIIDNNATYTHELKYINVNNQFVEYEFDDNTYTLKVTVYDYPLITITKKDADTNELLPNTLFTIYSVDYTRDGEEILEPAKDSKGNILGNELMINGNLYNVVVTNKDGKFNLDLTSGKYKVVEVQAADERYELKDNGYYFTVGAFVPHENSTISYYDSFDITNTGFLDYARYSYTDIIATSDNGWLGYHCLQDTCEIVKIDVYNETITDVPSTGINISGSYIFGGIVVIAGVATLMIAKRKETM